jgi:Mg-chelatase subunit ChlD
MVIGNSLRSMAKASKGRPVLVLDRSGSMADRINQEERKIDALCRIVTNLRKEADFDQLVFDTIPEWTEEIGEPRGGTGLAEALEAVIYQRPDARRVVLVTDGWPDNKNSTLDMAAKLTCPMDIFYVGPESDLAAQDFLRQLAEIANGKFGAADLKDTEMLENKVRLALKEGDPEEIAKGPIAL